MSSSDTNAGHRAKSSDNAESARVAIVIAAKDEESRIASTVRSARALPGVSLIVVVDDGSSDNTKKIARDAGAVAVRHTVSRGKASAMETGANVVSMREAEGTTPFVLLFLDAHLGESAPALTPLIEPIVSGKADCAIAVSSKHKAVGSRGFIKNLSRRAIYQLTGFRPVAPLSGQRCMTREAYEAAAPLPQGWGVETAMTIEILRAGLTILEVPCELDDHLTSDNLQGQGHRFSQFIDVWKTVIGLRTRQFGRSAMSKSRGHTKSAPSTDFEPYQMPGHKETNS